MIQAMTRKFLFRRPLILAIKSISSVIFPLVLSACTTFSTDGGFTDIAKVTKQRVGQDVQWQKSEQDKETAISRVNVLLQAPLTVDGAIQIALLNNRGLQATFFNLGISEADLVQAGQLPNPGISFGRTKQGQELNIDRLFSIDLARLLTRPYTQQMEIRRFEQTKREIIMQVLALVGETRKTYYSAIAADQSVQYMQQVKKAADAGAELARRLTKVGNFNKLQHAREQGFYSDAALNLARAEQTQIRYREKLTRLLGLWGEQSMFKLPARLPDLPQSPEEIANIEQLAMTQRLDIQAARLGTEQLAQNLGLSKATRFINVLELGVIRNSTDRRPSERGYQISLELPIFDWSDAKVKKSESMYMQAVNHTAEIAINAKSEVRESYLIYRSNYDIAKHYWDHVVPLKKRISEENQLLYNGMLIGVFDLLADARSQIASVNSAIEASRDFWISQAELEMSLIGAPSMASTPMAVTNSVERSVNN